MISIYTDGSAKKNGSADSKGGYGVIVCEHNWGAPVEDYAVVTAYQDFEDGTTNNRMEMKAILWALENFGLHEATVYSDSSYAVNTFNDWMWRWKGNGWKRPKNKPVENLDLVQRYDKLVAEGKKIELIHVAGHSGNFWNEMADKLATGVITPEEIIKNFGR